VMAVVTTGIKPTVLYRIFSGLGTRISSAHLAPFLSNMHLALWCMAGLSVIGALVSFARPKHVSVYADDAEQPQPIEAAAETPAAAAAA